MKPTRFATMVMSTAAILSIVTLSIAAYDRDPEDMYWLYVDVGSDASYYNGWNTDPDRFEARIDCEGDDEWAKITSKCKSENVTSVVFDGDDEFKATVYYHVYVSMSVDQYDPEAYASVSVQAGAAYAVGSSWSVGYGTAPDEFTTDTNSDDDHTSDWYKPLYAGTYNIWGEAVIVTEAGCSDGYSELDMDRSGKKWDASYFVITLSS